MNRYKSSQLWRRESTGVYRSACGRCVAVRQRDARWMLLKQGRTYGPYTTLADCQEIAQRGSTL